MNNSAAQSLETDRLSALLDEHRTELFKVPGVVGTGVGFSDLKNLDSELAIQIFVSSSEFSEGAETVAKEILSLEEVSVVVTGTFKV